MDFLEKLDQKSKAASKIIEDKMHSDMTEMKGQWINMPKDNGFIQQAKLNDATTNLYHLGTNKKSYDLYHKEEKIQGTRRDYNLYG